MEIKYSPEDDAFRNEVREWIAANKPKRLRDDMTVRDGGPMKTWRQKLYEKGWVAPAWPKEYGGAGFTIMQQAIFNEECARANVPSNIGGMGVSMVGPTIIAHGTEEQKKKYLPDMLSGNVVWCQGFSEPNAGSDMANLQSRAVLDGEEYVITGQKVWTSGADRADWCFYLARTDPDAPKHKGISYFLVDMKTPGIEVRPIKQITGGATFCEMFWDGVRVPKDNIVGEVNQGWYVAMSTLAHERSGMASAVHYKRTLERLKKLAREVEIDGAPAIEKPDIRRRLTQLYMDVHAMTYTGYRNLTTQLKGGVPGPAAFVGKVFTAELQQRIQELAVELQGPYGMLWKGEDDAFDDGRWQLGMVQTRAVTIYGGTSEINRNLVAERALGLPSWKTMGKLAAAGKKVG